VSLLPPPGDAGARIASLVARIQQAGAERVAGMVAFAERRACRHLQVAAHFGDAVPVPCGACDVCAQAPRDGVLPAGTGGAVGMRRREPPPPLPEHPAEAVLDAVATLRWPLGRSGLVSLLVGSVATPPSARGHPAFGLLGAVPRGTVERWVQGLVDAGHLVRREDESGYPVLAVGRREGLPRLGAPPAKARRARGGGRDAEGTGAATEDDAGRGGGRLDPGEEPLEVAAQEVFDALRAWRADEARRAGVPPYVVMHDRTLRELARLRPASQEALAGIPGLGARRIARYGDALLAVVGGTGPVA
jgi:ATP-dependent DNA helicase RecQ